MSEAGHSEAPGSQERLADITRVVVDEFTTVIGAVMHVQETLPGTDTTYIRAVAGPDVESVVISPASC